MSLENYKSFVKYVEAAAVALLTYLGIDQTAAGVLFILMTLDTFTGGLKALVLGDKFSFKVMAFGAGSKLSVLIVPFTIALLAKGLSFDFSLFLLLVMNILLVGEAFSVLTNILSIKKRERIQNFDFITLFIGSVRAGLWSVFKGLVQKIEDFKS